MRHLRIYLVSGTSIEVPETDIDARTLATRINSAQYRSEPATIMLTHRKTGVPTNVVLDKITHFDTYED